MTSQVEFKMRRLIKDLLKNQGGTYEDLAPVLSLSTSGVKRLMTRGELTVDRLEKISSWFGLTLTDFFKALESYQHERYEFSKAQEKVLASNPKALYVFLLLGANLPLEHVRERSNLPKKSIFKILRELDHVNLIELGANEHIRLLARGPYRPIKGGIFEKRYHSLRLSKIKDLISQPNEDQTLKIPFELYASEKFLNQMKKDMESLFDKYSALSRIEHLTQNPNDIRPISGIFLIKPFDLTASMLNLNEKKRTTAKTE